MFVSHVSVDRAVASWLRTTLERDFLGLVSVFVSSDQEGIAAGEEWFPTVRENLSRCSVLVTLCSPESIYEPWINFEVGAAWMLEKPIIPACHAGLEPGELPMPFSSRQGLKLADPDGMRRLYDALVRKTGRGMPPSDFDRLAAEVPSADVGQRQASGSINRRRLDAQRDVQNLIRKALEKEKPWRTIPRVAAEAAVPESTALEFLRAMDNEVRFSLGKNGDLIVGLISRVGPG